MTIRKKLPLGAAPVATTESRLNVDLTGLAAGTYTFELVVEDTAGVRSTPTTVSVVIAGQPVAVLTAPASAPADQPFTLDGSGSNNPGGTIANYYWSLTPVGI
jgi:hypothetical protein